MTLLFDLPIPADALLVRRSRFPAKALPCTCSDKIELVGYRIASGAIQFRLTCHSCGEGAHGFNISHELITPEEKARVRMIGDRETPLCLRCNQPGSEDHHILPTDWGVPGWEDVLVPLCPACHAAWHRAERGLKHLEQNPEARRKVATAAQDQQSKASPELMQALQTLLKT